MRHARPLFPVVVLLFCALAAPGCIRTPQSLCQEYVDAIDAMWERCGVALRLVITRPSDGAEGCGTVQQIPDPHPITDVCIPWANEIDTPDECLPIQNMPGWLIPECDAGSFQYVR